MFTIILSYRRRMLGFVSEGDDLSWSHPTPSKGNRESASDMTSGIAFPFLIPANFRPQFIAWWPIAFGQRRMPAQGRHSPSQEADQVPFSSTIPTRTRGRLHKAFQCTRRILGLWMGWVPWRASWHQSSAASRTSKVHCQRQQTKV